MNSWIRVTWWAVRSYERNCEITSSWAPFFSSQATASRSSGVVVKWVSEPVSSYIPSPKIVASSWLMGMFFCFRIWQRIVVVAPTWAICSTWPFIPFGTSWWWSYRWSESPELSRQRAKSPIRVFWWVSTMIKVFTRSRSMCFNFSNVYRYCSVSLMNFLTFFSWEPGNAITASG